MHEIDEKNPIISKGECECVLSADADGNPALRMFACDSEDILAASIEPIKDTEGMEGVVGMFVENHKRNYTMDYGDVFDGMEFLDAVRDGTIMGYDGFLGVILVDGYTSNLGLVVGDGFRQGRFLVDEEIFAKICEEHDVQVIWHGR